MPGSNAWRTERADALTFLIDGAAYFDALRRALDKATRSIRIVGWDFDPRIPLGPPGAPLLGEILRRRVEKEPALQVHVLIWAMAPFYAGGPLKLFGEQEWCNHPRICFRYDSRHAWRGSHHQKLVTIDDKLAFVGGMDLTSGRWDTPDHPAESPSREKPAGDTYGPVHDVHLMMSGPAAHSVAELCRWRWRTAIGERLPEVWTPNDPWPEQYCAELRDCMTSISRTLPDLNGNGGCCEAIRLTHDAIALARRYIYIETQYLASFGVADSLARRLREPNGPEVVIVVTSSSRGALEHFVMARNRNRLIRRMMKADRHGRLRVMYAVTRDAKGGECEILIHAKVLIVDDRFARIGSSNLNNRSEGLDTECDIGVEARSADQRESIASLRDRLLAEHLGTSAEEIARESRSGSMVAAIDRLNFRPRGLRPFKVDLSRGTAQLPGTMLLDPKKPAQPLHDLRGRVAAVFSWLGSVL